MFIGLLSIWTVGSFGESLVSNSKGPIKCLTLNNRLCQAKPTLDTNSDETLFYPFTVIVNTCRGSCNTIDDPYARVCVPNKVKNVNIKVFSLMSRLNETKFLVQYESCACKCSLIQSKNETIINVGVSVEN